MSGHVFHPGLQPVRVPYVIGIHKSYISSACAVQSGISGMCRSVVFFTFDQPDPLIIKFADQPFYLFSRTVAGMIIDQDEFPVGISLVPYTVDRVRDIFFCPVYRYDDTDHRNSSLIRYCGLFLTSM